MSWRTAPQTLLLVSLPLGIMFTLLNWGFRDMSLTLGNFATHMVVAMVYALWHIRSMGWFSRLSLDHYAGWKRVVAGGKVRFLFAYGMASKGMAIACLMVAMDWAATGAIPTSDKLLNDGMVWTLLGAVLAHFDWQRMQRAAASDER